MNKGHKTSSSFSPVLIFIPLGKGMHGKVTVLYGASSFDEGQGPADVSVVQPSAELGFLVRRSEVATSSNNVDSLSA